MRFRQLRAFGSSVMLLVLMLAAGTAQAQRAVPLRVVLDCQNTGCDATYFRTELTFAEFVRDVSDAHVQVLLTSQANGSGGRTFTLRFIGQGPLAGKTDVVEVPTVATATDDDRRRAIVRGLSAGLLSYVARIGPLDRFRVVYSAPEGGQDASPERDPWNRWIFTVSARGNLDGQKRYRSHDLNYNANARRVTELWKTSLSAYASENVDIYVLSDGSEDRVSRSRLGLDGLAVYSLGAQWSAGADGSLYRSAFDNTAGTARITPAIEYNFFPYSEDTQRSVILRYSAGVRYIAYTDTTIYDKTAETLAEHRLRLNADFQQPWGTLELSASGAQYLNHLSQYSISSDFEADVRLFRGLSVSVFGGVNLLRNQRNISGEGVSDDDVYTRRRALATGYRYSAGAGLSYTFGSAFSGAINPRFN